MSSRALSIGGTLVGVGFIGSMSAIYLLDADSKSGRQHPSHLVPFTLFCAAGFCVSMLTCVVGVGLMTYSMVSSAAVQKIIKLARERFNP